LLGIFLLSILIFISPTFDFLVKVMQYDFSIEKLKPVFADHFSRCFAVAYKLNCTVLIFLLLHEKLASSANMLAFIGNLQCLSILLIATDYSVTESVDPCGTPFSRVNVSESCFNVLTWNVLFFRKFVIKFGMLPLHITLFSFIRM